MSSIKQSIQTLKAAVNAARADSINGQVTPEQAQEVIASAFAEYRAGVAEHVSTRKSD